MYDNWWQLNKTKLNEINGNVIEFYWIYVLDTVFIILFTNGNISFFYVTALEPIFLFYILKKYLYIWYHNFTFTYENIKCSFGIFLKFDLHILWVDIREEYYVLCIDGNIIVYILKILPILLFMMQNMEHWCLLKYIRSNEFQSRISFKICIYFNA